MLIIKSEGGMVEPITGLTAEKKCECINNTVNKIFKKHFMFVEF